LESHWGSMRTLRLGRGGTLLEGRQVLRLVLGGLVLVYALGLVLGLVGNLTGTH
jgi:hypothetical protein